MPYIAINPSAATAITAPSPNPAAPLTNDGLTLAMMRAEILANIVARADVEPERIDFWINRAYIDLGSSLPKHDELRYSQTFNTVDDQPLYHLPSFINTVLSVAREDDDNIYGGVPLQKTDLQWYRRQDTLNDKTVRKPSHFFRMNRVLVVWPTPSAVSSMILDYRFDPLPMTADTHSPIFRHEWHEALMLLARKKLLSALNEHEAAMAVGNEFISHMRVRLDREGGEEENKIVSSSRPTSDAHLRRRAKTLTDY